MSSFPRGRAILKDAVAARDKLKAKLSNATTLADFIKKADVGVQDAFDREVVGIFAETINKYSSEAVTFIVKNRHVCVCMFMCIVKRQAC